MTVIRVKAPELRQCAGDIGSAGQTLDEIARSVLALTMSAPSYDGEFGPRVRALGAEAEARARAIARSLIESSSQLRTRVEAFEQVDRAGAEGLGGLGAMIPPPLIRFPEPPEWLIDLLMIVLSFFAIGDIIDILDQLWKKLSGQQADDLVLLLAVLGLLADSGHLIPVPSGEDAPNAILAIIKQIARRMPSGPGREALEKLVREAVENPKEAARLLERLARFGDEGIDIVRRYGDQGLEALLRHGDELTPQEIGKLLRFTTSGGEVAEGVLKSFGGPLGRAGDIPAAFRNREVIALGRLPDTTAAKEAGEKILEFTDWTMEGNFLKLQEAIKNGDVIHLVSPVTDGNLTHAYYEISVYTRELDLLLGAGYKRVGDFLVPPH
jgi:hypothetical protein